MWGDMGRYGEICLDGEPLGDERVRARQRELGQQRRRLPRRNLALDRLPAVPDAPRCREISRSGPEWHLDRQPAVPRSVDALAQRRLGRHLLGADLDHRGARRHPAEQLAEGGRTPRPLKQGWPAQPCGGPIERHRRGGGGDEGLRLRRLGVAEAKLCKRLSVVKHVGRHAYGEMWGDVGRYGQMWGDVGRCGEMWGDVGRCGEMWGDVGTARPSRGIGANRRRGGPSPSATRRGPPR